MSFKDFITNIRYRRAMAAEMDRYQNLRPPDNPSPRYIRKLVTRLLDPKQSDFALKELGMIGEAAAPALLAALDDPQYREAERPENSFRGQAPLDILLGLLVSMKPACVVEIATPLIESESEEARKIAAIHLADTGLAQTAPLLKRLLADKQPYVRSYVLIGLDRAIEDGRLSDGLREQAYGLLLEQCNERWPLAGNDSARLLIRMDQESAKRDLSGDHILSQSNPNLQEVLRACKRASIQLPALKLQVIFDDALPRVTGKNPYPHDNIAADALELLAADLPENEVRPLIDRALAMGNSKLTEAAAHAVARGAGIEHPIDTVYKVIQEIGYDRLTEPQRVVYCASAFDAEVCNGGLMQFFGNSSGDHAVDTLEALRKLDHAEAVAALSKSMDAVGPLSREPDREIRMEAFTGRFDELQVVFRPLESAYYKSNSGLRAKMVLYAAEHAADFR